MKPFALCTRTDFPDLLPCYHCSHTQVIFNFPALHTCFSKCLSHFFTWMGNTCLTFSMISHQVTAVVSQLISLLSSLPSPSCVVCSCHSSNLVKTDCVAFHTNLYMASHLLRVRPKSLKFTNFCCVFFDTYIVYLSLYKNDLLKYILYK